MKRYNCEVGLYSYGMGETPEGDWVSYEDVKGGFLENIELKKQLNEMKITAIMNFNLLDQIRSQEELIRERDDLIKELEQKVSRRDILLQFCEDQ